MLRTTYQAILLLSVITSLVIAPWGVVVVSAQGEVVNEVFGEVAEVTEEVINPEVEEVTSGELVSPEEESAGQQQAASTGDEPDIVQDFDVDSVIHPEVDQATGALTYNFPLRLPAGRTDMTTPEVAFLYSSRDMTNNGIAGYGWSLNIPTIYRMNKRGTDDLYDRNDFVSSWDGELVYQGSNPDFTGLYLAEFDDGSQRQYTLNADDSWTVADQEGMIYTFGDITNERQDNPNDSSQVYRWMLVEVLDTYGNSIDYTYFKHAGQIYPDTITYTNHASVPGMYTVNFVLTDNTSNDIPTYEAAFEVRNSYLIDAVEIKVFGVLEYAYDLQYIEASQSKRKLLDQIVFEDHTQNPTVTEVQVEFDYNDNWSGWVESTTIEPPHYIDNQGGEHVIAYPGDPDFSRNHIWTDFDADGQLEFIRTGISVNYQESGVWDLQGTSWVRIQTGNDLPTVVYGPNTYAMQMHSPYSQIFDVDGDGDMDYTNVDVQFNSGNDFEVWENVNASLVLSTIEPAHHIDPTSGDNHYAPYQQMAFQPEETASGLSADLLDYDNDGLLDIVVGETGNILFQSPSEIERSRLYLNNGAGWTPQPYTQSVPTSIVGNNNHTFIEGLARANAGTEFAQVAMFIDIDGDQLPDYIGQEVVGGISPNAVWRNEVTGWVRDTATEPPQCEFWYGNNSPASEQCARLAGDSNLMFDWNRDGLPDYISNNSEGSTLVPGFFINTGLGWEEDTTFEMFTSSNTEINTYYCINGNGSCIYSAKPLDFNGDGFTDVAYINWNVEYPMGGEEYGLWLGSVNGLEYQYTIDTPTYMLDGEVRHHHVNGTPATWFDHDLDGIPGLLYIQDYSDLSHPSTGYWEPQGDGSNTLKKITNKFGGYSEIDYRMQYVAGPTTRQDSNTTRVVDQVTAYDNLGNHHEVSYAYEGGYTYYEAFEPSKFAGFREVTVTEADDQGNVVRQSTTFFHQGDATDSAHGEFEDHEGKIGRVYRTEVADSNDDLYQVATTKWEAIDNGDDTWWIRPENTLTMQYDGTGSIATSITESYAYDTTVRQPSQVTEHGVVTGNNDGTFTDNATSDNRIHYTVYATGPTGIVRPVEERLEDSLGNILRFVENRYDGQPAGSVGTHGQVTVEIMEAEPGIDAVTRYTYDPVVGLVKRVIFPEGNREVYTYDTHELKVVDVKDDLNYQTLYTYDYVTGQPLTMTDPNGYVQRYTYDGQGRLLTREDTDGQGSYRLLETATYQVATTPGAPGYTHRVTYADTGVTLADSWQYHDGLGRLVQTRDLMDTGDYSVASTEYDAVGRVAVTSVPEAVAGSAYTAPQTDPDFLTTMTYDPLDRVTLQDTSVGDTSFAYDGLVTTVTDGMGNNKDFTYDAWGNLVQVDEYEGANIYTTTYEYNHTDNLVTLTDAHGNMRNFTYDMRGLRTGAEDLHDPADVTYGTYSYVYDLNGNQISVTKPDGTSITTTYDGLNRPVTIDSDDVAGVEVTYTYDTCTFGIGRACTVTTPEVTKAVVYNSQGLPVDTTSTINSTTYDTGYTYDYQGNILTTTYPDGTVVRNTYGSRSVPDAVYTTVPGGSEVIIATIDYAPHGGIDYIDYTSGAFVDHLWNGKKQYQLARTRSKTNAGDILQSYLYSYDNVGNITSIIDQSSHELGKTTTYTYDDLYRLTQVDVTNSNAGGDYTRTYTYGALGNILSTTDQGTYSYAETGYANPHAVTTVGTTALVYDANGNLIQKGIDTTYDYNYQNRMTTANLPGPATVTATYDENGERLTYITPTTTEVYPVDGYLERNGAEQITITTGGSTLATIDNGTVYYVYPDHLNSTALTTDTTDVITEKMDYYPFGETRQEIQSGTLNSKDHFTGHDYDTETNLTYAHARNYHQDYKRWYQQDPAVVDLGSPNWEDTYGRNLETILKDPQQLNTYSYARNNPVGYTDPNGEILPIIAAAYLAFEVASTAYDIYDVVKTSLDPNATAGEIGTSVGFAVAGLWAFGPGNLYRGGFNVLKNLTRGSLTVTPNVNVTKRGLSHVLSRHTVDGGEFVAGNTSYFKNADEISSLIKSVDGQKGVIQPNGNIARTVQLNNSVGYDAVTKSDTNVLTVITKKNGDLVTAHPGSPRGTSKVKK